jgi:mRNA interferase RelE/StbE
MSQGAATRIHSPAFDRVYLLLSKEIQNRIDARLNDMGVRLGSYPHHRMTGYDACRVRVGDYRIIYDYDVAKNVITLLSIGHRREIYRKN